LYMRGNDFWAGLFVALAVVTKVTPALLIVYFLYKRAWRVCIGAVIGLVLFFVVIPGLFVGFGRNFDLLRSWFEMMVAPYALHGYTALVQDNQALYAVLMRVLSNAGLMSVQDMSGVQAMNAGIDAMARPATLIGNLLRPAISLAIVGSLAWLCRTRADSRRDPRLLLEFGAVLLAMLLMSERTWKHHATTHPIVFLGVWYALTCLHWSDRFRACFVAGLVLVWLLLVGSSQGLVGKNAADMLLEDGGFCWGMVLCFAMVGVLLRGLRAPPLNNTAA
jgi:alpha-1,2-mannosyltransferase